MSYALILFGSALGIMVFSYLFPNKALQTYWSRACMGRAWKSAYPHASATEIRTFLTLFADSFFEPKKALFFQPSDKIMDVYNAIYSQPIGLIGGDACECEAFISGFVKLYGRDPVPIWSNDLTLGALFELAHAPNP